MTHPYATLLAERPVRILWGGLAVSATGSELYRVGAVWLAVGLAGGDAAFLVAAQSAAMLATSLLGGAVTDLVPRRRLLLATSLLSCAVSGVVVAVALAHGLTLPLLIAASVALAAIAGLTGPALMSGIPLLVPEPERLRAANGLFDGTTRSAQVVGPFLAASLVALVPAIHLLTLNALSFLAAAGAVAAAGDRLDGAPSATGGRRSMLARLARGAAAATRCPGAWQILATTACRGAAMALGFTVGVPLLLSGQADLGPLGLAAVAMVFGGYAAGEFLGNLLVVLRTPKDAWRTLFAGYTVIAAGLALVPVPLLVVDMEAAVPLAAALAFVSGLGGAVAGVQMLTYLGTRLDADDFAAVLRLRLALVIGAAMSAAVAGPWLYATLGVAGTMIAAGSMAAVVAAAGLWVRPVDRPAQASAGVADDRAKVITNSVPPSRRNA